MYMTSFTTSQKSKLSIVEALAVGTESEAPALDSAASVHITRWSQGLRS